MLKSLHSEECSSGKVEIKLAASISVNLGAPKSYLINEKSVIEYKGDTYARRVYEDGGVDQSILGLQ